MHLLLVMKCLTLEESTFNAEDKLVENVHFYTCTLHLIGTVYKCNSVLCWTNLLQVDQVHCTCR